MSDPAPGEQIASDLQLLARLHDREPDAALLGGLRGAPFQDWLSLQLRTAAGSQGLAVLDRALAALPDPIDDATLDDLRVDYADIYLTYACRAAPTESVWLDEDGLERQGPMFAVRAWYRHHGLAAADWRRRPDDHLVPQLVFVAHLLGQTGEALAPVEAARFMDRHILRWIEHFASQVVARCRTPYFAGLALVTAAYLDDLRAVLTEITGEPRWLPEPTPAREREQAICANAGR